MHYEDFSILFGPPRHGEYPVIVDRSPAGQARGTFRPPFSEDELATLRDRLGRFVRANRGGVRTAGEGGPQESRPLDPRDIGDRLFRSLFSGDVGKLLENSLAKVEGRSEAEAGERGLRIRLSFAAGQEGVSRLISLPWEVLYWKEKQRFLSLTRATPVVRSVEISLAAGAPPAQPPLRILALASRAASRAGISPGVVEAECEHLKAACGGLPDVELSFVEATPGSLRQALHDGRFHVLHFLGHGAFNRSTGEGALLFETAGGGPDLVPAASFADLVRDFPSLRLVVLTACESSRMPGQEGPDPFGSVASALLLAGLPAVIAMQYEVSGDASDLFTAAFYRRLAAGDPVDAATSEGRMALHLRDPGSPEWATPVFFLRAADSRIVFDRVPEAIRAQIIDRSTLIRDKTEGFVGRRWLFDTIDRFTAGNPRGYFVLRGDPGIGKSALIAQMVKERGHIHHFNVRAEGIRTPEIFLRNLWAQLVARHHLGISSLSHDDARDARFLISLLDKVSARLQPGERMLVLVDALDETDGTGMPADANPLFLPMTLPRGVFFVVTTRRPRPQDPKLNIACEQQVLDIEQDGAGNMADVRELVESQLPLSGIRTYIAGQGIDDETFVTELVARSQGNFMYLKYVLPEIERGVYRDRRLSTLPLGLRSYYEDHWQRMRSRNEDEWTRRQLPVLLALTVLKEPVSLELMADFSGIRERHEIRTVLRDWEPFLYTAQAKDDEGRPQKRYRLYHESFHDFIVEKEEVADERVDLKAANRKIADVLWGELYGEG